MNCPQCGYLMDPFDARCLKCHGQGLAPQAPAPPVPTTRETLTSAAQTAVSITSAILSAGASKKPPQKKPGAKQAFLQGWNAGSSAGQVERAEAMVRQRADEAQAARDIYERLLIRNGQDDPLTREAFRQAEEAAGAVPRAQVEHMMAIEKASRAKRTLDES